MEVPHRRVRDAPPPRSDERAEGPATPLEPDDPVRAVDAVSRPAADDTTVPSLRQLELEIPPEVFLPRLAVHWQPFRAEPRDQ